MDTADVIYSGILKKSPPERRLMRTVGILDACMIWGQRTVVSALKNIEMLNFSGFRFVE